MLPLMASDVFRLPHINNLPNEIVDRESDEEKETVVKIFHADKYVQGKASVKSATTDTHPCLRFTLPPIWPEYILNTVIHDEPVPIIPSVRR